MKSRKKMKKGIAAWIWIIIGVVLGLITLVFGSMLILNQVQLTQKQLIIDQFSQELTPKMQGTCLTGGIGQTRYVTIEVPENTRAIYVANASDESPPDKVSEYITKRKSGIGTYLCLQFFDENIPRCVDIPCDMKFTYIGTPSLQSTLQTIISTLSGNPPIYKFYLLINKTDYKLVRTVAVPFVGDVLPNITVTPENVTTTTTGTATTTVTETTSSSTTTVKKSFCQYTPEQLAGFVDSSKMVSYLQYLTSNPRVFGTGWNKATADDIEKQLQSYGLQKVNQESFQTSMGTGYNVVGEIGADKSEIIVAGGHRDSVNTPGAVDNGGGVVIVMEVSRILSMCQDNANKNIRFVLFDGEEEGLFGSRSYVKAHSSENMIRMMNFDCEGYKGSSTLGVYRTAGDLATVADQCCKSLNIPCSIDGPFDMAGASSDHSPFQAKGIQYLWPLTSCNKYHTSGDNMNEINGDRLKWAAQLAVCILAKSYISTS